MEIALKNMIEMLRNLLGKLRKGKAKGAQANTKRFLWFHIGLGALMVLTITLMFPHSRSLEGIDLREGDVYIGEDIIAPFTFAINKSQAAYQADIDKAKRRVPRIYDRDSEIAESQLKELETFLYDLYTIWDSPLAWEEKRDSLLYFIRRSNVVLPEDDINFFFEREAPDLATLRGNENISNELSADSSRLDAIIDIASEIYTVGILSEAKDAIPEWVEKITVYNADMKSDSSQSIHYYDLNGALDRAREELTSVFTDDEQRIQVAYKIITKFITPNIIYNADDTESRLAVAIAAVPLLKDQVLKNQKIINSHEVVTERHVEILRSLYDAKVERADESWLKSLLPILGRIFLVVLSLSLLAVFLRRERTEVFNDPKQMMLICLILLLVVVVAFVITQFSLSSYLIPIAIGSMLLTIFFDSRVGFLGTISLAILLGGIRGNDFSVIMTAIFAGSMAIVSVSKVRKRNWIIRAMVLTVAAYLISVSVVELLRFDTFTSILENWGFGIANGVLSPILTYGLLVVIEMVFDTTTDMTFLELSDLNHPLLRRLAMEAPGTYHHSIIVGNLAEAAVEMIGGNGLVARVGAYYHDIGKLEKPEYFVENQKAGRNPQEKLSPSMSALVLINHVRRGVDMAHSFNLPKEIHDFIEQHHGTSVMSFFYQKAREQNGENEISDTDFRYPGPKPQTREAGILMLADAVEAASRTLKEPSVSRIKTLVSQIIDDRFRHGELDECPLTLRDLNKIGEVFSKILIGWFHSRVVYPEEEKKGKPEESIINGDKVGEHSGAKDKDF